jgi:hypothetical protein
MYFGAAIFVMMVALSGGQPVESGRRARDVYGQTQRAPYQPRETWYEFAFRQFNKDDVHWGAWIEQRREQILRATVRDRCFRFSAAAWLLSAILLVICLKQRIDHGRDAWVIAELLADLWNQDRLSREMARNAIGKYNEHIDACNRTNEEREAARTAELARQPPLKRIRSDAERASPEDSTRILDKPVQQAEPDSARLVAVINRLQQELAAERKKNQRLKGAV